MRKRIGKLVLASVLALSTITGTAAAAQAAPHSVRAAAADVNTCYNHPSDANCSGAPVDTNPLNGDPCFADSYSLTYEYGYAGANFTYSDQGWTFETWLDYSPACKSNFTYTKVTGFGPLPYQVANKVRRSAGPDGGYLMEHSDWRFPAWKQSFASPLVYSPDNTAQACLSTMSSDQIQCTTGGPNNNGYY